MPSSPLLNFSPRKPHHETGPTSPQLTRSEPPRRVPRSALHSKASALTRTQSLDMQSCALPPPPVREIGQQSIAPEIPPAKELNIYYRLRPPRPTQKPVEVLQYDIPSTRTFVTRPAFTPTVYADILHTSPPQTPNRNPDSSQMPGMRTSNIYSPLVRATPLPPNAQPRGAYQLGLGPPTEEPSDRAPRSKRMTVASVDDHGQLDSESDHAYPETNARKANRDSTYDQLDVSAEYANTRLSTSLLESAWVPQLPPRSLRPHVAAKPDYLHSRNPFAKQGPIDPFVESGAVVGLTKKTFKKFLKDLDAAFVLFYNPCDKQCCGAKVHMRQAAHTTQKPNHAYAAVDCTKECKLCKKQNITTFPTMKLFVKGMVVDTYTHAPLLTSEIRNFVENAPLVRETVLEKSRCVVQ